MATENNIPTPENTPITPPVAPVTPAPDMSMKMPADTAPVAGPAQSHTLAIVISAIVLLTLLTLGGLYLWGAMLSETMPTDTSTEMMPEDTTTETQSSDDSINSLEAELSGEDFESIDAELNAIDAEIEGEASGGTE